MFHSVASLDFCLPSPYVELFLSLLNVVLHNEKEQQPARFKPLMLHWEKSRHTHTLTLINHDTWMLHKGMIAYITF
jgi:hypothetical protein